MAALASARSKTRRTYNLAAKKYHDLFHDELRGKVYDRELLDRFAANFAPGSLILDAGCGPSAAHREESRRQGAEGRRGRYF